MIKNFKFGVSQEDIEKQEALELRKQEAYIQQRTQERTKKLEQLNKKNKRNRIIVIIIFVLFFLGMLVFGTYNTFFKKTLNEDQIAEIVESKSQTFNTVGVEGFLHNSIAPYFQETASFGTGGENIESFSLDPNSVRVTRINPITKDSAIVYFNANVNVKQNDGYTEENGKRVPYVGESTYNEYQFRVLLGFKNKGYVYESGLELQPQILKDNYSFDSIELPDYLDWEKAEIEEVDDEDKVNAIKIKVDRILADLYAGKEVASDADINKFNTNDKYVGITEFKVYQKDNALGLNAVCTYEVNSIDNLKFMNTVYLKVSKDGNSWKIEKFL